MTAPHPLEVKLSSLSPQELETRRREIVSKAQGDFEKLSTDDLSELAYITSTLRRRSAGPPKQPRVAGAGKSKPTIDSLLDF